VSAGRGRLAIPLLALALLLGAAGCGGDDEDDTASVPSTSVSTTEQPTVPAAAEATTPPAPTTTKTEKTGGTPSYDPGKADTPENDVPPPPGSPQEAFERQCEQNPAACG
jgi:hypothetical protein